MSRNLLVSFLDFWLVVICWIPMPGINVKFLRLLRLMRLMKLVGKVKQLRVLCDGLIKGFGSVVYISMLLLLVFYMYAIAGVSAFRKNDPFGFNGIGMAFITLYRVVTFESWMAMVYINVYGCDSQHMAVAAVGFQYFQY